MGKAASALARRTNSPCSTSKRMRTCTANSLSYKRSQWLQMSGIIAKGLLLHVKLCAMQGLSPGPTVVQPSPG